MPKTEEKVAPVSFRTQFRFATRFEVFLNWVGILGAVGAGAASPLMTLLYGKLTQDFVKFGYALVAYEFDKSAQNKDALDAAKGHFRDSSANNALYLCCIGIGMMAASYLQMSTWMYTSEINAKRIREAYLRAVLRQDIAFFDNVGSGEITTRIQSDTHLVQRGISEKVPLAVSALSAFITGYVLAYVRNWRLALALSSILPCTTIAGALIGKFVLVYTNLSLKHAAEGGTLAEEAISTIRTAHAFGIQSTLTRLYDDFVGQALAADHKSAIWQGCGLASFYFFLYATYALAFHFGTTLILQGHATPGEIVNVFSAILVGSLMLVALGPQMQAIMQGMGAAGKLFATIDRVPSIDSASAAGEKPEKVVGEITLEHIHFAYPSRPNVQVLRDLSLVFPAGKTCALVGTSGSGKSTIISLIERFYDPLDGCLKLDGVDIRELNLKWLRSQIGLVSQEPTLFSTSIRANVEHGLIGTAYENASAEEKQKLVKQACVMANADGFVSHLPQGYDTLVGERGFLLSGGQKQRVAIARAIVSNPRILLLDEATSALDTQSEGIVQSALDKAAAGRTTIVIAHRLSTIRNADHIYIMENGAVVEQGTHHGLMENNDSRYAKLVAAQQLREQNQKVAFHSDLGSSLPVHIPVEDRLPYISQTLSRQSSIEKGAASLDDKAPEALPEEKRQLGIFNVLHRLALLNRENRHLYIAGTLAAIISGGLYPAYGLVFSKVIEGFTSSNRRDLRHKGDRSALWNFIIAIGALISISVKGICFSDAAARVTAKLRQLSFGAILRQDVQYFDKKENASGTLVSSLSDNSQKVGSLVGLTLGAIIEAFATLVIALILGIVFAWKLGLVSLAVSPIIFFTGYVGLRFIMFKDKAVEKEHEDSAQIACEAAGSIRTVASLTREDDCVRQYSQALEIPLQSARRTSVFTNMIYAFAQGSSFFVIALVFWYGSRLVADLELSIFEFFVGLESSTIGTMQAANVFGFMPDISSAGTAGSNIIQLIDSKPKINTEAPSKKIEDVKGRVTFEEIQFSYPNRSSNPVLRGLTFSVEPGTYVALVGASGCGKSTTIQLIERFYDPVSGRICLDGKNIAHLNLNEYRKHLALVSQEPTLYSGTVRFNILLGAIKPESEVTQEEVEEVCRKANILDFINSLPDKFETQVGGKGSQLSGGQKQRIAIARALLRNPKVLLLDEATSALDSQSEKVVQDALDEAAKGRTTIAIAHRLSTIQNADLIYFIKDGTILESGTHDELLEQGGAYSKFVQLQQLEAI